MLLFRDGSGVPIKLTAEDDFSGLNTEESDNRSSLSNYLKIMCIYAYIICII